MLSVRALKHVAHFYIGNDVRIFNTVTNEWSNWRKMSFTDANLIVNHDAKAQLKLRDILKVDYEEYKEVDSIQGNKDTSNYSAGVYSLPENVRRYFLTMKGEQILEATKRGYDLFGLLENGYAVLA